MTASLCGSCDTPLRDCPYLLNSKLNQPAFMPGQEHVDREILNWDREPITLYITTKCPLYVKEDETRVDTPARRKEVFDLWMSGVRQKEIGERLGVAQSTIAWYIKRFREDTTKGNMEVAK